MFFFWESFPWPWIQDDDEKSDVDKEDAKALHAMPEEEKLLDLRDQKKGPFWAFWAGCHSDTAAAKAAGDESIRPTQSNSPYPWGSAERRQSSWESWQLYIYIFIYIYIIIVIV